MTTNEHDTALTIDDIRELSDEDGQLSLYAKGHHSADVFLGAVQQYLEQEYDNDYAVPTSSQVHYGWARLVPTPEWGFGQAFVDVGGKVRSGHGVFPYTIIEEVSRND